MKMWNKKGKEGRLYTFSGRLEREKFKPLAESGCVEEGGDWSWALTPTGRARPGDLGWIELEARRCSVLNPFGR